MPLLVPLAAGTEARSRGGLIPAGLVRKVSALLDAAGVRLEDFVLADDDAGALADPVGAGSSTRW